MACCISGPHVVVLSDLLSNNSLDTQRKEATINIPTLYYVKCKVPSFEMKNLVCLRLFITLSLFHILGLKDCTFSIHLLCTVSL